MAYVTTGIFIKKNEIKYVIILKYPLWQLLRHNKYGVIYLFSKNNLLTIF